MHTTLRLALILFSGTLVFRATPQVTVPPVKFTLPPRDFAVNLGQSFVVEGDFNNDGIPDVFTIDDNNIGSVFLGSGMGSLLPPKQVALAGSSMAAVAVDLNGDGNLDMVYSDQFGISVLLGKGDGTFVKGGDFSASLCCGALAVGDFNRDGKPDIIALNSSSGAYLYPGNGDGSFQRAKPIATPVQGQPYSVYTADVNGDGKMDFIVRATSGVGDSTLLTYLGNGNGTFGTPLSTVLPFYVVDLAPADFNGDRKVDLGITISTCCSAGVGVLLGNGDGTFQAPLLTSAQVTQEFLRAGDFNHDGKWDLAVGANSSGLVTVYLGNGDGTFETPESTAVGGGGQIALGDFNADSNLDIVCVNLTSVSLLLGKGDGSFYEFRRYSPGGEISPKAVALGDMNGDGRLDMVTANAGTASVLLNNGDATFQAGVSSPSQTVPEGIAVGDFNGDGKLDAATVGGGVHGSVNILLGKGDGSFQAPAVIVAGSYPLDIVAADVNGDGKLDLLLANSGSGSVSVLLGKGDGTFQAPVPYQAGERPISLAVGDLNGDGKLDIVTADEQGSTVSFLFGNGDGTFQAPLHRYLANNPTQVAIADLDGDGKADVAVVTAADVTVLINSGQGAFRSPVLYNAGAALKSLAVADINGDGIPDVLALTVTNDVAFLLGAGDGTLLPTRRFYGTPVFPFRVLAGDLNGDGKLDVVVGTQKSLEVMVNTTP